VIINEENFKKQVGSKIKELRKQKGLSQFELSIECIIPKNQIGRIERGEISPTLTTIVKIANGLKIHPKEFFEI